MGGDLNLKKSFHPSVRKNQERVWKAEKSALEERKLIDKLRREREEERATEELQKLQAESGGKVITKRVDWMYSGPGGDGAGIGEDREGYLLGKRRIDNLIKSASDTQSLQKGAAVGIDAVGDPNANANTARDTHKKVLQDPLLMIQKQKMELQLKAMKDAEKEAKYAEKRAKEKERERKHKHREKERSRDREYKHRSRRDRSRSPRRRDDREDRRERESYRRRSSPRSRSRSPYQRHTSRRERSQSPRRRDNRSDMRNRDSYRRRDRTPPRRQSDDNEKQDQKADRLAQMQAEAASLEKERAERVREQEIKNAEEEEKNKQNMDGGRRFISSVRGQASNMDLGEVMARGRQNYRAEVDA